MAEKNEPNIWLTVAKLVIGAVALIGGTGAVLWYVNKEQERNDPNSPSMSNVIKDWGIAGDSPVRK